MSCTWDQIGGTGLDEPPEYYCVKSHCEDVSGDCDSKGDQCCSTCGCTCELDEEDDEDEE